MPTMEIQPNDSIIRSSVFNLCSFTSSPLAYALNINKCSFMCVSVRHLALWLSVCSVRHKNIMFTQSDHEPQCCSNTESQGAGVTGSVKWRVMTPVQRKGLVEMTLKHGTSHSAPVKCLKKAFPTPSQPAGGMNHPHAALHASLPAFSIYCCGFSPCHISLLPLPFTEEQET